MNIGYGNNYGRGAGKWVNGVYYPSDKTVTGFGGRKTKKGYVKKVWNSKRKYWDYEIVGDEKWKPKGEYITKKMLEQQEHSEWFLDDSLASFDEMSELKKEYKNKFEDYENLNDFKKHLNLKRYSQLVAIEMIFFHFFKEYPLKNVLYCKDKLKDIYESTPSLDRLKYRKNIKIPEKIQEVSGIEFGVVNFWIFKDSIIFKN